MNKVIDSINHTSTTTKAVADVGAIGIAWGAFFTEVVPAVASVLSVVWLSLQIYSWAINKRWKKNDPN